MAQLARGNCARQSRAAERGVAVCLTGLWRAGSDLDRCRSQFLGFCVPNATVFRINSILGSNRSKVQKQQWRQIVLCEERIRKHELHFGVRFARVLRTRPDTITYPISVSHRSLPNCDNIAWTYRCFWGPSACSKVQLNDVHMIFSRATFGRLATPDFAGVTPREGQSVCNFTGATKDYGSFECWLHVQAFRRNISLAWRSAGDHPSWILHRTSSPEKRQRLSRLNCACALPVSAR